MADTVVARSPLFAFADVYVSERAFLDPIFGTEIGVHDVDHLLPDFSKAQSQRNEAHTQSALDRLKGLEPQDDLDRVAKAVMTERLEVRHELERSGEDRRTWGVISSPLSLVRQAFELMDASNAEQAEVIRLRLLAVRGSLKSWQSGLEDAAGEGQLPSRRHVVGVADQARRYGAGAFQGLATQVALSCGVDPVVTGLTDAAIEADGACVALATWLSETLAPQASEDDRSGIDRYRRWYRYWNGSDLEVDDLYAWGWQELRRIKDRMWVLAGELAPGVVTLAEVVTLLDADEQRAIHGADALLERLEAFTKNTVQSLDGVHFDIDARIRQCDVRLAPEGAAAAPYYISPSEDLSRPGTTWFPTRGATRFTWWRYVSMWYHEAVPGHHLQIATALLQADRLSRFHRLDGSTSGYSEGWALYAERLMDELGGYVDPADEMGYLAAQALRAARIVIDLGLHMGLAAPDDLGVLGDLGDCSGQTWSVDMAVALLEEWAIQPNDFATSEVDRYLSIPGQATSYKVGERTWLEVREAARNRFADQFDIKKFHAHALALGPMGLGPFRDEMREWDGH
ncbi:MAG: DUF885 domain-containing protein [Acidimicrobiales bacterium]